jgi:hypothetical protein
VEIQFTTHDVATVEESVLRMNPYLGCVEIQFTTHDVATVEESVLRMEGGLCGDPIHHTRCGYG